MVRTVDNEPRVPKGSPGGGEWMSGAGAAASSAFSKVKQATGMFKTPPPAKKRSHHANAGANPRGRPPKAVQEARAALKTAVQNQQNKESPGTHGHKGFTTGNPTTDSILKNGAAAALGVGIHTAANLGTAAVNQALKGSGAKISFGGKSYDPNASVLEQAMANGQKIPLSRTTVVDKRFHIALAIGPVVKKKTPAF